MCKQSELHLNKLTRQLKEIFGCLAWSRCSDEEKGLMWETRNCRLHDSRRGEAHYLVHEVIQGLSCWKTRLGCRTYISAREWYEALAPTFVQHIRADHVWNPMHTQEVVRQHGWHFWLSFREQLWFWISSRIARAWLRCTCKLFLSLRFLE